MKKSVYLARARKHEAQTLRWLASIKRWLAAWLGEMMDEDPEGPQTIIQAMAKSTLAGQGDYAVGFFTSISDDDELCQLIARAACIGLHAAILDMAKGPRKVTSPPDGRDAP